MTLVSAAPRKTPQQEHNRLNLNLNLNLNQDHNEPAKSCHKSVAAMANQYLLAAASQFQMAANMINNQHHHNLELTTTEHKQQDNNNHHQDDHEHDQQSRFERAPSVTSDQFSSLNLSSSGSSAHHSPIIEHAESRCRGHQIDEHAFGQLTITTALDKPGIVDALLSPSSAPSDYHGSIPCSPVDSIGSPPKSDDDLLLLTSPASQPHATLAVDDHRSLKYEVVPEAAESTTTNSTTTTTSITINNNNNNHLHPDTVHHQKARSYSHSTAFSPLVPVSSNQTGQQAPSPARSTGKALDQRENQDPRPSPTGGTVHLQQPIVERPRRLSRIENRQSLHDLGYGRIESYFKLQRLGKGTYATVYMGRSKLNNDLVALKEILKEHDEGAPCTAIREVSLLRLLRHNNIVTLHDICHTPKKLTLVFEYVGPDLYAYMKENNHLLSIHNVRLLLYQLLRGIAFCHSRQVLHRDLKPQNLLINSRGELKICDFGLARAKSIPTKSYSNEVVTLWYRPPDVLLGNTDYDHSIDMWGVGCIFYEMASGRTFFPGSSVRQQLYLIFSSLGAPSQGNWPEILTNPEYLSYSFPAFRPEKLAHRVPRLDMDAVQLLQSFLRFKPSERISADEARRDPFFACLPERVHHLNERESIFEVPGVYVTLNPGQKLNTNHNNNINYHHHHR